MRSRAGGRPAFAAMLMIAGWALAACGGGAGGGPPSPAPPASSDASPAAVSGADDPSEPSPDPSSLTAAAPASGVTPAAPAAPAPAAPGPGLAASGGWSGQVNGRFRCGDNGSAAVLTMEGNGQLVIRAEGGKVVSASYLGERMYGGSPPGGLPGSLGVQGRQATVRGVSIPPLTGGGPLVLNGTVTCT